MSRFQWLIREIHRRSLWQVALTYLGVSWIALQVTGHVVDRFELAEWAYGAVVLVLLVGLPLVIATAIVQEGPPGSEAVDIHREEHAGDPELFRWRNAIFGGIAAGLLVVLAVGGWYVLSRWDGTAVGGDAADRVGDVVTGERPAGARGLAGGEGDSAGEGGATESPRETGQRERETGTEPGDADPMPAGATDRFPVAGTATAERADPSPRPIRRAADPLTTDANDQAAERASVRSAYRAALQQTDSARARAMTVDAAARAPDRWREADSLYRAGVARAAEGSYATAERDLLLARMGYEDARARAARAAVADDAVGGGADDPVTPGGERAVAGEEEVGDDDVFDPMAVVQETLASLEDALEAEDTDALRRVWVTASEEEVENFVGFFREARELDVRYEVDGTTVGSSGDRIEVRTRTTWTFRNSDGQRQVQGPFRQQLVLERRAAGWVVVSY